MYWYRWCAGCIGDNMYPLDKRERIVEIIYILLIYILKYTTPNVSSRHVMTGIYKWCCNLKWKLLLASWIAKCGTLYKCKDWYVNTVIHFSIILFACILYAALPITRIQLYLPLLEMTARCLSLVHVILSSNDRHPSLWGSHKFSCSHTVNTLAKWVL
jgi:hypothetical protein